MIHGRDFFFQGGGLERMKVGSHGDGQRAPSGSRVESNDP